MSTAADRFREITIRSGKARRALIDFDRKKAIEHLNASQVLAQDGLREAMANESKLEAASMMADFIATWKDCLAGTVMSQQDFNETSGLKEYNAATTKVKAPSTGEPT